MGAHRCAITRQILADPIIEEQALFTPPLKAEFLLLLTYIYIYVKIYEVLFFYS